MNKKDCKIIQDLLPNYVEVLTNDETNHFIEGHLKECKNCNETYLNMKENFYKKETEETENINFLKKHRKKIRILRTVILVGLAIFLIVVLKRTFIMIDLSNKAARLNNPNNYYLKINTYQGDILNILESYYKNGNYLTTITSHSQTEPMFYKFTTYKNGDDKIAVSELNNEKYYLGDGRTKSDILKQQHIPLMASLIA